MAGIAQIGTVDMRRMLAAGVNAVMTAAATAGRKSGVIRRAARPTHRRYPRLRVMAGITFFHRRNMRCGFSHSVDIVVAA
jgi:hypothetical protein